MFDQMGCNIKIEFRMMKIFKVSSVIMKGNMFNGVFVLDTEVVITDKTPSLIKLSYGI